jgi:hypothetical protein
MEVNMKKKAIKIAIFFLLGLFGCVLVSRVIAYTTAPKARFTKLVAADIYSEYVNNGTVEYTGLEKMYWQHAVGNSLMVTEVKVQPGPLVNKGNALFKFKPFQDASAEKAALEKELQGLAKTKLSLYEAIIRAKVNLNSSKVQLAREYIDISCRLPVLRKAIQGAAVSKAIKEDVLSDKKILLELVKDKNVKKELTANINEYIKLSDRLDVLSAQLKRRSSTDYTLALQWYELLASMDEIAKKISDMEKFEKGGLVYTAPKKGRVTAVFANIGDLYSGTTPLYTISQNEFPSITIPINELSTNGDYQNNSYSAEYMGKDYRCQIKNFENGKFVLEPDKLLFTTYSIDELLGKPLKVTSMAPKVPTEIAIPVTAIIEKGAKKFIYTVVKQKGLWEEEYIAKKVEVSVGASDHKYASITTNLKEDTIILDKWDRSITEGQRVYEYVE